MHVLTQDVSRRLVTEFLLALGSASALTALVAQMALASPIPAGSTRDAGPARPGAKIRVRLAESASEPRVRAFDLALLERGRVVHRADRLSEWRFRCHSDGSIEAIESRPTKGTASKGRRFPSPLSIETPAGFLSFDGKPYRETIHVHASKKGCEIVNEVGLEEYLDGLVNAEFSSKWSEEAVAAQVVAARTYAYHRILEAQRRPGSRFDVESTVRDQVYGGSAAEDFRASRIVERTRGLILTVPAGSPIKAFYHSTCGGLTELPQRVWGATAPGFKRRVSCPYCRQSPAYQWQLQLTEREILDAIRLGLETDGIPAGWPARARDALRYGRLIELRPKTDEAGRVLELQSEWLVDQERLKLPVSGVAFRNWIGAGRFRSTAFQVAHRTGGWLFSGRGNGHGVGMCQWGAKVMGEKGKKMAVILRHYYPDAVLKKLW